MSDIVLSPGVRSNLLQLQQTSDLITQTQTTPCDRQARQFGARQSNQLLHRSGPVRTRQRPQCPARRDVDGHRHHSGRQQRHYRDHQAGAVGPGAGQPGQPDRRHDVRATLAAQFNALLPQIDQLAGDSGFNGINLLGGNDLTDHAERRRHLHGGRHGSVNDTTAGDLAINNSANNWAAGTDIAAAANPADAALTTLRSQAQSLARICRPCRSARTSPRR